MRKQIGSWLLILASLAAPATASAQELRKWCASPLEWTVPPADPQVFPGAPADLGRAVAGEPGDTTWAGPAALHRASPGHRQWLAGPAGRFRRPAQPPAL